MKKETSDARKPEEDIDRLLEQQEQEAEAEVRAQAAHGQKQTGKSKGRKEKKKAPPVQKAKESKKVQEKKTFRQLWRDEMTEAKERAGSLWGRFRQKDYMRPQGKEVRSLLRRRFLYREQIGILFALCPLVGVTNALADGILAGLLSTLTVLCSAFLIEIFRRILPGGVGSLCHMILIAGFTSGLTLVMQAIVPRTVEDLGIYLPMTVVSCLVLEWMVDGSREKGMVFLLLDSLTTGVSFTLLLAAISLLRELLASGTVFGFPLLSEGPLSIMSSPFGGFFCLGCVTALVQGLQLVPGRQKKKGGEEA